MRHPGNERGTVCTWSKNPVVMQSRGLAALKNTFRALAVRDFRLYFLGQSVSLVGTWVQQIAFAWIAYRVTGSVFMLGLIAFCGQSPALILSPFSAVLTRGLSRRGVLIVIQVIQMALAVFLGTVVWLGVVAPWMLVVASLILGSTTAIETPVRLAFTPYIVHDRAFLSNAVAINSATFNAARLVGPAVAAVILAAFGEAACFAINALSYIGPIYTLLAINPAPSARGEEKNSLRDGVGYVRHFAPARWLLTTVVVASFCLAPFMAFMPVYAKDNLNGGADTLGILMAAYGGGALLAGLYLASRESVAGLGARSVAGCFAAAVASFAFAFNHMLWVALLLLLIGAFGTIIVVTSSNMLLQSLVPDNLRTQVMAFYSMSFSGMLPLASLAEGALAQRIGVEPVFVLSAALFACMGYSLYRKLPELREASYPVLREKGLLRSLETKEH